MKDFKLAGTIPTAAVALTLTFGVGAANAASVSPTFDTFGELSAATFGGNGIPNDNVAISTLTVGSQTLTLGLTATQRYQSPPLTNDGSGTFFAQPGDATLNDGSSDDTAAWNFGWYAAVDTGSISDFDISLYWDIDPGAGTPIAALGSDGVPGGSFLGFPLQPQAQGSQNLAFNLSGGLFSVFPGADSPAFSGSFDQDALGEYSFLMTANQGGQDTSVGINVIVGSPAPIPVPAALPLLLAGLGGLGLVARRKRKAA